MRMTEMTLEEYKRAKDRILAKPSWRIGDVAFLSGLTEARVRQFEKIPGMKQKGGKRWRRFQKCPALLGWISKRAEKTFKRRARAIKMTQRRGRDNFAGINTVESALGGPWRRWHNRVFKEDFATADSYRLRRWLEYLEPVEQTAALVRERLAEIKQLGLER